MKIIIFDYDGTIADSLDSVTAGFNYATKKYGIKTRTKKEVAHLYHNNIFESIIKLGISRKEVIDFVSEMRREYARHKIKLFSGMKEVVNKLEKKNKVFIMTSNFGRIVRMSVKANKIKINVILGAEWGISKVKKLNLVKKKYPNAEIFYIGDTVGDMIESRKAGVKNIAVIWGFSSRKALLASRPDFIVNRSEDLLKIIN